MIYRSTNTYIEPSWSIYQGQIRKRFNKSEKIRHTEVYPTEGTVIVV